MRDQRWKMSLQSTVCASWSLQGLGSDLLLLVSDFPGGQDTCRWGAQTWEPGTLFPLAPSQVMPAAPRDLVSLASNTLQSLLLPL